MSKIFKNKLLTNIQMIFNSISHLKKEKEKKKKKGFS